MTAAWSVKGKTALVTGGTTGIGRATVAGLASRGSRVIFTARNPDDGDRVVADILAATGNDAVSHRELHLDDLASVRALASSVRADFEQLHMLINNAGVSCPDRHETTDGFELMFGVNHLGHFLLTEELRPLLLASAPSRIVIVASTAHRWGGPLDFDDLQNANGRFGTIGGMRTYGRSKLANVLHSRELARRLRGTGVTVNCVHPGLVRTRLGRDSERSRVGEVYTTIASPFLLSPERGASTLLWAACASELEEVTGAYLARSKIATANANGRDDAAAARLWAVSEALVQS